MVVLRCISSSSGHIPHFARAAAEIQIQHLISVRPVEPLDVRVLHGSSWLDKLQLDIVVFSSAGESHRHELRSIIHANSLRIASLARDTIQDAYHPRRGQVEIDFNGEGFSIEVVDHVELSEPPTAHQGITHKVHLSTSLLVRHF